MKKVLLLTMLVLGVLATALAQVRVVTGKVTDPAGTAVPGAAVLIKGTTKGTVTDAAGAFRLEVADNKDVLVVRFIGYKDKEVAVGGQTTLSISLQEDSRQLEEVVVVGYGTQKKADLTGSLAGVKADELQNIPVPSVTQSMQGRVAGVQISNNTSRPGAGPTVRVRGNSSISAGNAPLYVVDGVPIANADDSQSGAGMGLSPIASLNPEDIESVDVLKDASAAAIYGSRASNGVILITTKRGRKNSPTQIDFTSYTGVQKLINTVDMLNAQEYRTLLREARANAGLAADPRWADDPSLPTTNWTNEVLAKGNDSRVTNYQVSAKGGGDKTVFYVSGGYFKQDAILQVGNYERYSGRLNVDHNMSSRVKLGTSIGITSSKAVQTTTDNSIFSPWSQALRSRPDQPVYNADGTFSRNSFNNPVHSMLLPKYETSVFNLLTNSFLEVEVLKGLKAKTAIGVEMGNSRDNNFEPKASLQAEGVKGAGFSAQGNRLNILWENTLDYRKSFLNGDLNMNALVGYTFQRNTVEYSSVSGQDFPSDNTPYLTSAAKIVSGSSSWTQNALESVLGRLVLDYKNRYFLTGSIRRDGSSKFNQQGRYGVFPSVSAAWKINEESFLKTVDIISTLKLRGSFGVTGNQEGIGNFASRRLIGSGFNYNDSPGMALSAQVDENLQWETTEQANVGMDFGILSDRITLSVDVYQKKTRDLLLARPLPVESGFRSMTTNIGEMSNQGIEIALNTVNLDTDRFNWSTQFNISSNSNKIDKLYNKQPIDFGFVNRHAEGQPVGRFFLIKATGLDQEGNMTYEDINGDGAINAADRQFIGNPFPTFFGGMNNTFSYKMGKYGALDLNVFFQYSYGNDIYKLYEEGNGGVYNLGVDVSTTTAVSANMFKDAMNRWTPENTNTDIPKAIAGAKGVFNTQRSSRFVEDGSYLRLKTLSIGYTLPKELTKYAHVQNARVYFTGQNIWTLTNYSGFDPEASSGDFTDQAALPQLKTYTLGVNVTF